MRNIFVDFDGVINSYKTHFTTPTDLPDPPVPGAIEWLENLTENFHVTIYTTRMIQGVAQAAIVDWMLRNGLPMRVLDKMSFSCIKGGADVYIDDRAYRFTGVFPSVEQLRNMKPWHESN